MKTKTVIALFAVAVVALAIAQTPPTYPPEEAAKHVGETATITGRVDGFHQSGKGNIFLNMGGKYPNQAFTAFIPSANAGQFSQAQQYEGKTIFRLWKDYLVSRKSGNRRDIAITDQPKIIRLMFVLYSLNNRDVSYCTLRHTIRIHQSHLECMAFSRLFWM
jgi:hypothetical protein